MGVGHSCVISSCNTCRRLEMTHKKECITVKTQLNPRILFLAIATFAVGTDAYVIAGILPEIAHDLHIQVDQAGQMVTLFALAYAVGSPILAVATARVARRWLLTIVLIGL